MGSFTKPLPTEAQVLKMVDNLIDPQDGDAQAHALIELVTATANFENPEQANLANAIIDRAYQKTRHFYDLKQKGLRDFIKQNVYVRSENGIETEMDKLPVIG